MSHYQLFQNGLKVAEVSGPKAYAEEIVRRLNSFNLHGSPLREG